MRLLSITTVGLLSAQVLAAPALQTRELDDLQAKANANLLRQLDLESTKRSKRDTVEQCTSANISIRREFGSLKPAERKAYTDAVLCLQSKGANTPADLVPGAKSRYDDFVATHVNQTMTIHYTGTFLAWHRYFVWVYEQALRDECGYTGYQPYWDWPKYANSPQTSPIFNGDDYSMSGNGVFKEYDPIVLGTIVDGVVLSPITIPRGLGGGCVSEGPFKNMSVNLGPVSLGIGGSVTAEVGPQNGLGYNPRCLKRDVNPSVALQYTNITAVTHLITSNDNIADFQNEMQGEGSSIGVHGGGHYTIAGDPGGDLFTSPGDPAFWLHHGQIDRMWTIWQALDLTNRQNALSGTGTFLDNPPSPNTTLDTIVELNYAGGVSIKMGDLMSPLAGPFCYRYE